MTDIPKLLIAMAKMEGFYKPGTRPNRNNNPGDIEWGKFAQAHGATHAEQPAGRFAVFPSPSAGFAALAALLRFHTYRDLTVAQMLARYAPCSENNTGAYLHFVCQDAGCEQSALVRDLVGAEPATPAVERV